MTTLGATASTTTFPAVASDVGAQAADATLTALAGLATGADKFPYSTGTDAFSQADLTAAARTVLDDANVGAMRATLGGVMTHRTGGVAYYCQVCSGTTNNQADTLNVLFAAPWFAPTSLPYDRILIVATATVSNAVARLGIYNDAGGKPGTLVADYGTVAAATAGDKTITINQTLSGWYWIACVGQTAAPNLVHATGISTGLATVGTSSGFSLSVVAGYSQTAISGALPDPWGATLTEQVRCPLIYLRAT